MCKVSLTLGRKKNAPQTTLPLFLQVHSPIGERIETKLRMQNGVWIHKKIPPGAKARISQRLKGMIGPGDREIGWAWALPIPVRENAPVTSLTFPPRCSVGLDWTFGKQCPRKGPNRRWFWNWYGGSYSRNGHRSERTLVGVLKCRLIATDCWRMGVENAHKKKQTNAHSP